MFQKNAIQHAVSLALLSLGGGLTASASAQKADSHIFYSRTEQGRPTRAEINLLESVFGDNCFDLVVQDGQLLEALRMRSEQHEPLCLHLCSELPEEITNFLQEYPGHVTLVCYGLEKSPAEKALSLPALPSSDTMTSFLKELSASLLNQVKREGSSEVVSWSFKRGNLSPGAQSRVLSLVRMNDSFDRELAKKFLNEHKRMLEPGASRDQPSKEPEGDSAAVLQQTAKTLEANNALAEQRVRERAEAVRLESEKLAAELDGSGVDYEAEVERDDACFRRATNAARARIQELQDQGEGALTAEEQRAEGVDEQWRKEGREQLESQRESAAERIAERKKERNRGLDALAEKTADDERGRPPAKPAVKNATGKNLPNVSRSDGERAPAPEREQVQDSDSSSQDRVGNILRLPDGRAEFSYQDVVEYKQQLLKAQEQNQKELEEYERRFEERNSWQQKEQDIMFDENMKTVIEAAISQITKKALFLVDLLWPNSDVVSEEQEQIEVKNATETQIQKQLDHVNEILKVMEEGERVSR